jgi:hypothetical protein
MKSRTVLTLLSAAVLVAAVAGAVWTSAHTARPAASTPAVSEVRRQELLKAYADQPITFIENRGQLDARVHYYAQGSRYGFYFTLQEAMLSLIGAGAASPGAALGAHETVITSEAVPPTQGFALALRFLDSNPQAVLEGAERAPGQANYLRGNDPAHWQTGLSRYGQVAYRDLWPGITMMLREQAGQLKYEFRVRPGAHVADIHLAYQGAAGLTLDDMGGLLIQTDLGALRDAPPVAWQDIGGARVPVESRYVLDGDGAYGFAVGASYQPDHELIIDPGLDYATLLGGASDDYGAGIAVDAAGNAYVVGTTQSPDFPTTPGAFRRTGASSNFSDVFVSKLNPAGTALVYSTFLGGSNFDWGRGIAIDGAGNAYVAGQTKSSNFPITGGAFDRTFNVDTCPRCGIDQYDAFVAKLNPAGSALVYSTFLGGFDLDDALGIAVDGAGNAYVAGETGSSNFPTTAGAIDRTTNGAFDAFVTKLNPAGSALVYSTLLGGTEVDYGQQTAVDAAGNAYVLGATRSPNFPTTAGAFDTTENGAFDAFVAKLNPAGSALVYSTFLGGLDMDSGAGLAIDTASNAYVAGGTASADFPTTPGAFDTTLSDSDAFVTKLNAAGSGLVYSTLFGGSGSESGAALALDTAGNAWVTGGTSSLDFPVTADALDSSLNGGITDAFVAKLNPAGSALGYATFFGGTNPEGGADLALSAAGNLYITGKTYSPDFPTTPGAFDRVFNGDPSIFWGDGFVFKLTTGGASPPTPTSSPTPASQPTPTRTPTPTSPSAPTPTRTPTPAQPTAGTLPAPTLVSPASDARFSPGQSITFDWGDVAGAASYTIQIDNSQSFSAPLTVDQATSASQFTISTLPTTRMWWRVRANAASGAAGSWSSARRFEVKD